MHEDAMLAMAYVDGELSPEARKAFEARLHEEPRLADHVAEMRSLALVARSLIPPEPEDREWRRLGRDSLQVAGLRLVWLLGGVALLGLVAAIASSLSAEGTHWGILLFVITGGLGFALLLGLTLRERLAVLPLDPYRKLQR
ncbi:MAG TPA: hypothetical protein PLJ12_04265 [Planctomycetota bacterium]|nr:hypothetical protein [Planctomycetota bacterium]